MKPLQPVNGYEIAPDEWIEAANAYAGAATRAWLAGLGLAADVAALLDLLDEPIEAPPLDQFVADLGEFCQNACNAADFIVATLATDYDKDELLSVIQSLAPVEINALAAQRAMARVAEIALGICNRADPTDETARAERAAVVTLLTHKGSRRTEDAAVPLASVTYESLITELSGALTRLALDPHLALRLSPVVRPELAMSYSVSPTGDMVMRLDDSATAYDADDTASLVSSGWENVDADLIARWEDPVAALEPTLLTVDTIRHVWKLAEPFDLQVTAVSTL